MINANPMDTYIDLFQMRTEVDEWLVTIQDDIEEANKQLQDILLASSIERLAENPTADVSFDELEPQDHEDYADYEEAATFIDEAEYYGEQAINDNYFVEYTEEMARDCYDADFDSWPCNLIDWDRAAEELKIDYSCVEWAGNEFWVR